MNDDLIQRLLSAESNFLVALESGSQMLAAYNQTWSALPDVLHTASKTGTVDNETLYLAHSVAARIENIASCLLDIRHGEDSSSASLQSDCDIMLHRMATLDLNGSTKSSWPDNESDTRRSRPCANIPTSNAETSYSFLASTHRWLMDNLHNPYPTTEVKAQIAAASCCQVSSINSWFVNARRRIGWTTLCRERFSNCRADMIDAAYRALVEEDPQRTLSPEIRHSFVAIKVTAEGLYSSTFIRSAFAGDLDAVVKDMTEKNRESRDISRCHQAERVDLTTVVRESYPSPDPSIATSPVPALEDSLTNESEVEDVGPPIIAGSKRRRSSKEPVDQPSFVTRPMKRLRASTACRTFLPSPPSSTDGTDKPSDHGSLEFPPAYSTQPEDALPSRKRRLSGADGIGMSKRPCGSTVNPHSHIASDPLPCSNVGSEYSIDDWFNANFDALFAIPPPVDATEPDFSASWEVELFKDYNIPGVPNHALKYPPAPMADTQISAPTGFSDLDSLLQSIGSDTFITPPETLHEATDASHALSFNSSIPGILQTSTNWTSLLNGTEQPTICSTYPQYPTDPEPLPEIDLTMLQLPLAMETVDTRGDFASKLHQLHVMQEAVRRMEQELQAEGIVV